jgi:hypothetical protein
MNDSAHIHATGAPELRLRCSLCGEAIGVYEPLIAIERGRARQSSCAAEPEIGRAAGEFRHRECHERRSAPAPRGVPRQGSASAPAPHDRQAPVGASASAVTPHDGQGSARACAFAPESALAG